MQVAVAADIVVTGRNVEVPAHYRVHIAEKLARLERYGSHVSRIVRYDVVLDHEKNPRQSKVCQRVEITGRGTGPTVRAEACGPDFRSVLDAAVGKLQETLRRSHDRRRVHHGRHQPISVAAATAPLATAPLTAAVVTDPDPCRFASTKPPSAVLRRGPMPGRLFGLPFRRDARVREDALRRLLYTDDRPERADDSYVHTLAARLRGVLRNP